MATALAKKNTSKAKPLDVFVWHGVNRKGKKISGELSDNNII
jgi:type IV pilus assembly protein PilC